jgi:hypothetical protein
MHLKPQQKPINEDKAIHLVAGQLEVFGTVGKPLPTSLHAGIDASVIALLLGHESIQTTVIYLREVSGIASDGRRLPGSAAMQAV